MSDSNAENHDQQYDYKVPLDDDSAEEQNPDQANYKQINQMLQDQHFDQNEIQNQAEEMDDNDQDNYEVDQNQMHQDMLVQMQMQQQQEYQFGANQYGQYRDYPMQAQQQQIPKQSRQKFLSEDQQQNVLRKAMILDKADRKKTEVQLKLEVEELKKMRNKDVSDIRMLKVELNKLETMYKKYKEAGGFQSQNIIQLPDAYVNTNQYQDPDQGIIDTSLLLDDMNFVKNQFQCELIKIKNQGHGQVSQVDNFFKQRNYNSKSGTLQSDNAGRGTFQNQSSVRLQINTLKAKCKLLQEQIAKKDEEIAKIKARKGANKQDVEEKTKAELKRAHAILKQLKKRLRQNKTYNEGNVNIYEAEYNQVMAQLQEALGIQNQRIEHTTTEQHLEVEAQDQESISVAVESAVQNAQSNEAPEEQEEEPSQAPRLQTANNEDQCLDELRQKIVDLKSELEMSPRQFEDKLLHKLREEIIASKQKMQEQLQHEIEAERQRLQRGATGTKRKEEIQSANRHLQNEVYRLKNVLKKNPPARKR